MRNSILFIFITLLLFSCDVYISIPEKKIINKIEVTPPVFFSYVNSTIGTKTVEISTKTDSALIFYTIDGTEPNIHNYYSAGISKVTYVILSDTTINAIAYKNGYYSSVISSKYSTK
ncbi:MAG: hypothetical protein A2015_14985 [Spirochaetes bacterium GWF1_31_7]|nr:MAG: hypothetical protein A2Y30_08780 [Spirochaetes bacterium GWE1_32_154]OHD47126.1 MAG: hypothetical protein A2Y29_05990 [Spirochaetes bacterium GWE2_31_10]OHD48467.1 MAG: hypothetical protein A2015_14985 [Spirochaetes bacterium GWF1_31_7]